jgi:citrate lyase subunit beta/citryl-CoA lyase
MNPVGPAWLFCPADRPDRYGKALERADRVILDLEDAVATDRKDFARTALLEQPLDTDRVIVRINALTSAAGQADLETVWQSPYRTVMVPKVEDPTELDALDGLEAVALCETAAGVLAAPDIARHANVTGLMWGAEDLVADMGGRASRDPDGRYYGFARGARSRILLAAAAARVIAVDGVYLDIGDHNGLREESREAVDSGFTVKACIHPSQTPVVREAFRPTLKQVAWAKAVLAGDSGGVAAINGIMVDGPVVLQAQHILARHERNVS